MINILSPRPSRVLMIDEQYIKNTTEIPDSVDSKLIIPSIQFNQDKKILPILGNNIFQQWKDWIYSGVTIQNNAEYYFDANNLLLLKDWIQPCLSSAVMIELVYKLNYQIRNKGILESHSQDSSNISEKMLDRISEMYRQTASFYAQRAIQFLRSNPDIWMNYLNPQLGTQGNGADLFYPQRTKYFAGIHLPGMNANSSLALGTPFQGWGMSLREVIDNMGYIGNE